MRWMEEEKKIIFRIQFQSWYAGKITADKKTLNDEMEKGCCWWERMKPIFIFKLRHRLMRNTDKKLFLCFSTVT